ncbi:MAG: hypothetical protein IPL39_13510 [Opitutaceae bacterium]|nr:hypothetical protein [Opitutaceae bacterium]
MLRPLPLRRRAFCSSNPPVSTPQRHPNTPPAIARAAPRIVRSRQPARSTLSLRTSFHEGSLVFSLQGYFTEYFAAAQALDQAQHLARPLSHSSGPSTLLFCVTFSSMLISLQEAAFFLHSNHPVIDELWRRRDTSVSETELLAIIGASQVKTSPGYVLSQLKEMRFIVEADALTGEWELALPFVRWLEHLQMMARPVSSGVVQARLASLTHNLESFTTATTQGDWAGGRENLRFARETIQQINDDLAQTRTAIATAVSETKSEHRRQGALERFRRINRLWQDFLLPILELLDPTGPLEVLCTRWERQLALANEKAFLPERRIAERIERDMQYLRVSLRQSFRECRNEMEPLHASLRRDSLLAEGAARILRSIERDGIGDTNLANAVRLSTFRFASRISEAGIEASLARFRDIAGPPRSIGFSVTRIPPESGDVEAILEEVLALPGTAFPIEDLLRWLGQHHQRRNFHALLQAFSLLVGDSRYVAHFLNPISEYDLGYGVVRCGRVSLEFRHLP